MSSDEIFMQLEGAKELSEWFGYWPSLHDAEIVEVALRRSADSRLVVHGFRMNSAVSESGHYVCDKHALITFTMENVSNSELIGFNGQNVISDLAIERKDDGYRLVLGGCYGLEGWIDSANVSVSFIAGMPPGSIYERVPQEGLRD